jgi:DNA-binding SARP family transcriptional activator
MMTLADNLIGDKVQSNPPLRVYMLGRFDIEQGERLIQSEDWRNGKARSLFKILLSRRGYQITRQEVVELLWPELDQERAANNLNQTVYNLRRTLEPELERPGASSYIKTEGPKIWLHTALIGWVDHDEFKKLHKQAQLSGELGYYESAAAVYGGDYLPEDLYEDWSVSRREALRQEWTELLLQLAALYRTRGQTEKYQECLRRVLENDFSHEESLQKLMLTLNEVGRRDEALALYRNFTARLKSRLNLEPLAETREIYRQISENRVAPTPTTSAPVAVTSPTTASQSSVAKTPVIGVTRPVASPPVAATMQANPAPVATTSVEPYPVGREAHIAAWWQIVNGKKPAFLIIEGAPGSGKSSLLTAFGQEAGRAGFTALAERAYSHDAGFGLRPFVALLQKAVARLPQEGQMAFRRFASGSLQVFFPELSLTGGQAALYQALLAAWQWLTATHRVALELDDAHELTAEGQQMLGALATHCPIPIVATGLAGRELLPDANCSRLSLPPLNPDELYEGILRRVKMVCNPALSETLYSYCDGNVGLGLTLLESWQAQGFVRFIAGELRIEGDPADLFAPVAPLLRQSVGHLTKSAQTLLALTALAGEKCSFETLRQVIYHRQEGGGWWIDFDKTQLGTALTELTTNGVLIEQGVHYSFKNPLLARAIVQGLSFPQRTAWSEVVGEANGASSDGKSRHCL